MTSTYYDVIVVGGGNAALCAAMSARDEGASVLVLERAPEDKSGGNSAFTSGSFRMVHHGLEDMKKLMPDLTQAEIANTDFGEYSAEQYLEDVGRLTEYYCDPDLAETLVRQSTDTVNWIHGKGMRFIPLYGSYAIKQDGRYKFYGGVVASAVGGGRGLVEGEMKAARRDGVEIRFGHQVKTLLQGVAGVEGVTVRANGLETQIRSGAVVLACGGFEANREWRSRYLGPGWDMAKVRGTRFNTGDGIRMALDIGAQSYGQWTGCHAVSWERYAPDFGDLDAISSSFRHSYPWGILVNGEGKRFVDEGADFRNFTYAKYGRAVLQQPASFAWQVFDSQVLHLLRDEYKLRGATKVRADTLEELVKRMQDVNPARFLATVHEFNAAIKREVPFNPNVKDGRCTEGLALNKANWANALETPPFEAYSVGCGITFTFGGLKIDISTHVLDISDAPIPGLYGAGELVGGLWYFNYPGSAGLMAGSVFGRIAGREAATFAKQNGVAASK